MQQIALGISMHLCVNIAYKIDYIFSYTYRSTYRSTTKILAKEHYNILAWHYTQNMSTICTLFDSNSLELLWTISLTSIVNISAKKRDSKNKIYNSLWPCSTPLPMLSSHTNRPINPSFHPPISMTFYDLMFTWKSLCSFWKASRQFSIFLSMSRKIFL